MRYSLPRGLKCFKRDERSVCVEIKNGNTHSLLGGECGLKSAPFVSELSEKRPANSRPPKKPTFHRRPPLKISSFCQGWWPIKYIVYICKREASRCPEKHWSYVTVSDGRGRRDRHDGGGGGTDIGKEGEGRSEQCPLAGTLMQFPLKHPPDGRVSSLLLSNQFI